MEQFNSGHSEKSMLRTLRAKPEQLLEVWMQLNEEELCNVFLCPPVTTDTKLKRMRGAKHVACMEQTMNAQKLSDGKVKEDKTYET
jgi:hypothetical protein